MAPLCLCPQLPGARHWAGMLLAWGEPCIDTSCVSLFVGKFGKDRTGEQVPHSSGLPHAHGISSWSCAVPASARARARAGRRSDTVRDASVSVWSRVPFARVWSAVAGPGSAAGAGASAQRCALLPAGAELPAHVPGVTAAPGPAAQPAAAHDLARPCGVTLTWMTLSVGGLATGEPALGPEVLMPSRWSVCSVHAVVGVG